MQILPRRKALEKCFDITSSPALNYNENVAEHMLDGKLKSKLLGASSSLAYKCDLHNSSPFACLPRTEFQFIILHHQERGLKIKCLEMENLIVTFLSRFVCFSVELI